MRRFAFLIPFLFILASLLQLLYISLIVVSPDQLFRPLLVLWLFFSLLLLPAYKFTHDWIRATFLVAIIVAGFCFSSSFFSTILLSSIVVGVVWIAVFRLRRLKANLVHFAVLLSGVSIFYIAFSIIMMGDAFSKVPWDKYQQAVQDARTYSLDNPSVPSVKRDIYFVVLDGYARADILRELYDFDNSKFINYLQEQGFVVPTSSVSNYPATHLSVASTLNMDYIQKFSPGLDASYYRWLMNPFIERSRVRSALEQQGYTTVSISTNWSITDNATTDVYFHPYPVMLNDFEGFILDSTPLKLFEPLLNKVASVASSESQRKIVLYNFDTLADLPELPGPKFVFTHIISPHPPFVFDRNGNPVDTSYSFSFKDASEYPETQTEYQQRYLDQLQFVNENLQRVIESILANSETPPIIILQADHGSGMLVDFGSSKNTCVRERFSPFAAYYLPNSSDELVPDNISSVNIFRMIFNEYFGTSLPTLESKQYYYSKPVSFYAFEDVTARVDDRCE